MKVFSHILICILSLTIICGGSGVSIRELCTSGCRANKMIVKAEKRCCCKQKKTKKANTNHKKDCCKATYYKVEIVNTTTVTNITKDKFTPEFLVLSEQLFSLLSIPESRVATVYSDSDPPPKPDNSRFYLHLYSTLII